MIGDVCNYFFHRLEVYFADDFQMCVSKWNEKVTSKFGQKLCDAILMLINLNRRGKSVDLGKMKQTLNSLGRMNFTMILYFN